MYTKPPDPIVEKLKGFEPAAHEMHRIIDQMVGISNFVPLFAIETVEELSEILSLLKLAERMRSYPVRHLYLAAWTH